MKQQCFSSFEQSQKKTRTKPEVFLAGMERIVPWAGPEGLIAPHDTRPHKGRPQMPWSVMLRNCFLQQWYGLSDPSRDAIPDETTILNFRHLPERHSLTEALFAEVSGYLEQHALLLCGGTITDATLIAASPSTRNGTGKRDPEMRRTKKGNQWQFGTRMHMGGDAHSGLVHTAKPTRASRHDAAMTVLCPVIGSP